MDALNLSTAPAIPPILDPGLFGVSYIAMLCVVLDERVCPFAFTFGQVFRQNTTLYEPLRPSCLKCTKDVCV